MSGLAPAAGIMEVEIAAMTDLELLKGYVGGDHDAFGQLFRRHANWVYSVASRRVCDPSLAEDVTQATFILLARQARTMGDGVILPAWLLKTVIFMAGQAMRSETGRKERERRAAMMRNDDQKKPMSDWEWMLDECVRRLGQKDRQAVMLRFYAEKSLAEIGIEMGTSEEAARKRISRAMESLKRMMDSKRAGAGIGLGVMTDCLANRWVRAAPARLLETRWEAAMSTGSNAWSIVKTANHAVFMGKVKLTAAIVLLAIVPAVVWIGAILARADGAAGTPRTDGATATARADSAAGTAPAGTEGAGTGRAGLEFHILADRVTATPAQLAAMDARLAPGGAGPAVQAGDTIAWFEVEHPEQYDRAGEPPRTRQWGGKHYLPLLVTADASMNSADGKWRLQNVREQIQPEGTRCIEFSFDNAGAKLFGDLTTRSLKLAQSHTEIRDAHARLAVVVDGRIISVPNINAPITGGSGIITGGGNGGFTADEIAQLLGEMRDSGTTQP